MAKLILNSGRHLLELIDDVLEFSSGNIASKEAAEEAFNLRELTEELTNAQAIKGREKLISVRLEYPELLHNRWRGDAKLIKQVLNNLLNNALKFTSAGSVTIRVNSNRRPAQKQTEGVRFEVEDTGIGIPKEASERIFEPFQQVENTLTRNYGGTGLGLSICRQLVRRMNGEMGFESTIGKGSLFWFWIPIQPILKADLPKEDISPSEDEPSESQRVLVVDDNDSNRVVASHILKRLNCQVKLAVNGQDSLEKVQNDKFDLILMDLRMPVLDGIGASQKIRKTENPNRATPIVAVSAFLSETIEAQCTEAGINRCISKPVTYDLLKGEVANARKFA